MGLELGQGRSRGAVHLLTAGLGESSKVLILRLGLGLGNSIFLPRTRLLCQKERGLKKQRKSIAADQQLGLGLGLGLPLQLGLWS